MKQVDYVIHRPLTEAKGSGKHLDKVVQNIVDDLPKNPSWDDIDWAYSKAKSFEKTKSSWSGGSGLGITNNYFHRVAKKLNLPFIFTDGEDGRPGRVKADGTGTGRHMDPFDSSKDEAEEMNKRGILSPAARIFYDLDPPSAAKPDEPEPEEEKPEEEKPEGPRTQTLASPLRFKDDNKQLDIDNIDDYLAGGGSLKPGEVSNLKKPDRPVPPASELPSVNKDDKEQATQASGGSEAPTLANKKDEHPCPDAYFFYNNTGDGYAIDFYMNNKAQPVRITDPSIDQGLTQKGIGALNKSLKAGTIDCQKLASGDAEGSGAGAALSGIPLAFSAALLRKKPKLPPGLPDEAGRLKPTTPDGKKPTSLTPDGKKPVVPDTKKPILPDRPVSTPKLKKPGVPDPKLPELPKGSKLLKKPKVPKLPQTPEIPTLRRPLTSPIKPPKVTSPETPRLRPKKPQIPQIELPNGTPEKPKVPTAPEIETPRLRRPAEPLPNRPLVPDEKIKVPSFDKPAAPKAIPDKIPTLKLKPGVEKPIDWDIKVKYPEKVLQQVDLPDAPPVETNKLRSRLKDLSKRFKDLFSKYKDPWDDILRKLGEKPSGKKLAQALAPIEALGQRRLKVQELDPPNLKKLSDYLALHADNLKLTPYLDNFEFDIDRNAFKIDNEIIDLGDVKADKPLTTNSDLTLKPREVPKTTSDLSDLLKRTSAKQVPIEWFKTPTHIDSVFNHYKVPNDNLLRKVFGPKAQLPKNITPQNIEKLAKVDGLDFEAQKKLSDQLRQSFNGQNGTIDVDRLKLNLAKNIVIDPTVDSLEPDERPKNVDRFSDMERGAFDYGIKDEIDGIRPRNVDDTKDRFAGLDDSGIDKDATARAIRDRAQRQLKDVEAEMDKAKQITNAEKRAAKAAEIEDKLEQQRKDARANLSDVEGELTTAQKKAHQAHIAAIDDLKAELSTPTFDPGEKQTPGTMLGTPDAERQALNVADELTKFVGKLEKGTYPDIPAAELEALKVGDMPSSFHSKLDKGTYPDIPDAERQALLSIDPNTTFTSKAKPGTFPNIPDAERQALNVADELTKFVSKIEKGTYPDIPEAELDALRAGDMPSSFHSKLEKGTYPDIPEAERNALLSVDPNTSFTSKAKPGTFPSEPEAERLAAMSGEDPKTRFVGDEKPGTFEPDAEIQAAKDRIEELQKKSTKAAAELKQTELADQQFVKDYQDAITAEKIRHRQEILRLEKIQSQGQAGRDTAAEERRAQAYKTEIDQLAADKQAAIQKGWEAITSQEAARGEQLVDDNTRKVLAQDAGIEDWKYDPTKATSQVNTAAANQSDAAKKAQQAAADVTRIANDTASATTRPVDEPDMTAPEKINQATNAIKGNDAAPDMTLGTQQANDAAAQQADAAKPKLQPDMFLGGTDEVKAQGEKAINDSTMLYDKAPPPDPSTKKFSNFDDYMAQIKKDDPAFAKKLERNGIDSVEKLNAYKESATTFISDKRIIEQLVQKLNKDLDMPADSNSSVGNLQNKELKKAVNAAGGPEEFVKKTLTALRKGAVASRAASKAGQKAILKALKLGAGAIAGGFGFAMALVDSMDIWIFYDIALLAGVVEDPDDQLNKAREKDKQKVEDIIADKNMSLEQKKAEIKRIFWYEETWYEHTINFLMTSVTQFGRSGDREQWDPGQLMSGEVPQPITVGGEPITYANFNNLNVTGTKNDLTGKTHTKNDIEDMFDEHKRMIEELEEDKWVGMHKKGKWILNRGGAVRSGYPLGSLAKVLEDEDRYLYFMPNVSRSTTAFGSAMSKLDYIEFAQGDLSKLSPEVQEKYRKNPNALRADQEAMKEIIDKALSKNDRDDLIDKIDAKLGQLQKQINLDDYPDNRADALYTHSMEQLSLQRWEPPKMESRKMFLMKRYISLLEQIDQLETAKYING